MLDRKKKNTWWPQWVEPTPWRWSTFCDITNGWLPASSARGQAEEAGWTFSHFLWVHRYLSLPENIGSGVDFFEEHQGCRVFVGLFCIFDNCLFLSFSWHHAEIRKLLRVMRGLENTRSLSDLLNSVRGYSVFVTSTHYETSQISAVCCCFFFLAFYSDKTAGMWVFPATGHSFCSDRSSPLLLHNGPLLFCIQPWAIIIFLWAFSSLLLWICSLRPARVRAAQAQQCVMDVLLQSFPYGAGGELAVAEARLHGSPPPEVHKGGLWDATMAPGVFVVSIFS